MHCINVWLQVRDVKDVSRMRELLAEAGRLSRGEPGNLRFEVYHSQADEQCFLLCEHWESAAAWEAHREERAFREIYAPQVLPLVERMPHVSTLIE